MSSRVALVVALCGAALFKGFVALADSDDRQYEYDPTDMSGSKAATVPDMEGTVGAPTNLWHACKFGAKKGGIFDLRGLSRNDKLLRAHMRWGTSVDLSLEDWIHQDVTQYNVTYYLNVCADVIELPELCKNKNILKPSPAYQVSATGHCHYLGTLKTFKWMPIDTNNPGKGMMLFYQNGGSCGTQGQTKTIKYVFTCSRFFDENSPMVIYQKNNCNYDVVWPSKFGCPETSLMQQVGFQDSVGQASSTGKIVFALVIVLGICAIAIYFFKQKSSSIGGYSSL